MVDYLFNIKDNQRLDVMNRFGKALYALLAIAPLRPVQTRNFIVSHTEFGYAAYNPEVVKRLIGHLGIDPDDFVPTDSLGSLQQERPGCADSVIVFRTTCMNPFSQDEAQENMSYVELFVNALPDLLRKAKATLAL